MNRAIARPSSPSSYRWNMPVTPEVMAVVVPLITPIVPFTGRATQRPAQHRASAGPLWQCPTASFVSRARAREGARTLRSGAVPNRVPSLLRVLPGEGTRGPASGSEAGQRIADRACGWASRGS